MLGGDCEFLQLEVQESIASSLPGAGDVRVMATLQLQEFSGRYDKVWLCEPALSKFIQQLSAVVESRCGAAVLNAASPDELVVEIKAMDTLGHFEVLVRLGRLQWRGHSPRNVVLAGGFEIDATQLPAILAGFKALSEASS